jgi:hypothetical protein
MKDAKGHGSDNRGGPAHQQGVNQVGRPVMLNPKVLAAVKANPDGGSARPDGSSPTNGYMVSLPGHSLTIPQTDWEGGDRAALASKYANDHAAALNKPAAHLGWWTDKEKGETYLDVSQNIKNRNAAVRTGQSRNQRAIYDVRKGRDIATGGTGK